MMELPEAIDRLKNAIREAATAAVLEFEGSTGLTPSSLEIEMLDITTHSDKCRRSMVGAVRVNLGKF